MSRNAASITERIKQFARKQKAVLGYERYQIRSEKYSRKYEHWVDVYTRSGLVIKTKLCCISDAQLEDFITRTIGKINTISRKEKNEEY